MKIVYWDENTLILRPGGALPFVLFGLLFLVVGLLFMIPPTSILFFFGAIPAAFGAVTMNYGLEELLTTWTFDRVQGILIHRHWRLFGTKMAEYPLSDIAKAQFRELHGSVGDSADRVEIRMHSGSVLPLSIATNLGLSSKKRAVAAINEFLNIPPDME